MIRKAEKEDIHYIMEIWLHTNIEAHAFIPKKYWEENYELVKMMLPDAELYVYEDDSTNEIKGFIGINDTFIEGIFIQQAKQSKGIGKKLLDYVKTKKEELSLRVYQKNKRAVQFYLRENFIVFSEEMEETTREKEYIMIYKRAKA